MSTPPSFELAVHRDGHSARIAPHGELDIATAPELERTITDLVTANGVPIVLDLRGLTFMDSTGLRALVQADQLARDEGVDLSIVRGSENIDKLFAISGLDELLPLVDSPRGGG